MPLIDATLQAAMRGFRPESAAEFVPRSNWPLEQLETLQAAMGAGVAGPPHAVRVAANHGRWIVRCPGLLNGRPCQGGQLAAFTDHRFMCQECQNVSVDGLWRRTIWPKNKTAIDAELERRPVENQNWEPGESIADLRAEVPTPDPLMPDPTDPCAWHTGVDLAEVVDEGTNTLQCGGCGQVVFDRQNGV